jgi:dihydrofolate synthase/folylpolyglutamate synthase
MLADKDYEPLIGLVASRAAVFIACSPDSPRALTAEQIARCAQGLAGRVLTARSPAEAVKLALAEAGDGDCVLATGSLYLIGAISQAF